MSTRSDQRVGAAVGPRSLTSLGGDLETLAALPPFFTVEDSGPSLDQARQHLEYRYRSPAVAMAGAEAAVVQLFGDAGVGAILDGQLNDLEQHLALRRVLFQVRTVSSHPQPEWDLGDGNGPSGVNLDLALPFNCDWLPSLGEPLAEIFWPKWTRNHLAHAFFAGHIAPFNSQSYAADMSSCHARMEGADVTDAEQVAFHE